MSYVFDKMIEAVAEEDMTCNSFQLWLESKDKNKYKAAIGAFYARHGILKGEKYLFISVFDEDTGELLEFVCLKEMHRGMINYNLYPDILKDAFKK